jgi:hypothetical protein
MTNPPRTMRQPLNATPVAGDLRRNIASHAPPDAPDPAIRPRDRGHQVDEQVDEEVDEENDEENDEDDLADRVAELVAAGALHPDCTSGRHGRDCSDRSTTADGRRGGSR